MNYFSCVFFIFLAQFIGISGWHAIFSKINLIDTILSCFCQYNVFEKPPIVLQLTKRSKYLWENCWYFFNLWSAFKHFTLTNSWLIQGGVNLLAIQSLTNVFKGSGSVPILWSPVWVRPMDKFSATYLLVRVTSVVIRVKTLLEISTGL